MIVGRQPSRSAHSGSWLYTVSTSVGHRILLHGYMQSNQPSQPRQPRILPSRIDTPRRSRWSRTSVWRKASSCPLAQTRGSGYAAPDPRVQRTPCTESGAPGDGMAKWVCRPCKRTARQRSRWRLLSSHLKKCKYQCQRHILQCRFTGSARRRPGNPVVSYSPVRGFYDQVVARYHQTGRYNDEAGGKSLGGDQRYRTC